MKLTLLTRENRDGVATLRLDNQANRNALSRALTEQLTDTLASINSEPDVRVVILTGNGTSFCAGMDLKEVLAGFESGEGAEQQAIADAQRLADLLDTVHHLNKPTIAALNGDAYGGGLGLAMNCDFVIAADGVKMGYPEVRRGLVGSMVLQDLVRHVGERRARYLLMTGESITAEQALAWGMINSISSSELLMERAEKLAASLVQNGPNALSITKKLIDEANHRPKDLRGPAAITAAVRVSDEAKEGITAFLQKRQPLWKIK